MALSAEDYLQQLQALLPSGAAWPRDSDSDMARTLSGLAREFARIGARAEDLLREFNPATAVELLPEWEKEYEIVPPEGATIEERQRAVTYRYIAEGDIKKPYYIGLAASMGYTVEIRDYTETMVGWYAIGDELIAEEFLDFMAGVSSAGDTLGYEDSGLPWVWEVVVKEIPANVPSPTLEEVLEDLKPQHIQLNFTYP